MVMLLLTLWIITRLQFAFAKAANAVNVANAVMPMPLSLPLPINGKHDFAIMTSMTTDDAPAIDSVNIIIRSHFAVDTAIPVITKCP